MIKISKQKILPITALLIILFITSTYAAFLPSVSAKEVTNKQKGQTILNNVVSIDLAKYSTTASEFPQDLYLGVALQENIRYNLQSNTSKLEIIDTFTNGNLRTMCVLNHTGSPFTTNLVTAPLDMAKYFLSSYQSYSGDSLYGNLGSMLNNVDANKNLTTINGNTQLDVTTSSGSTTFRWTYTYGGVKAPVKCVALSYSDGFLDYFVDNWNLYKIGSTSIKMSEKEAIDDGLDKAKNFSWTMGSGNSTYQFKDFNVTQAMIWETIFSNSLSSDTARGRDPLTLYPMRHVWVSLDKFYVGNVYGIEVFFWADTKELYDIQERFSTLDPPSNVVATSNGAAPTEYSTVISMPISPLALPTLAGVALVVCAISFAKKKKFSQSKAFKIGGLLLCALLSSSVLLFSISAAYAVNRNALIWGSRSSGSNDPNGAPWRKTSAELENQNEIAADIADLFSYYGNYSGAHNYQGPNSLKNEIQGNISYSQNNYPFTAVVDFDHGVGNNYPTPSDYFHFMLEDDIGTYESQYPIEDPNAIQNGVYDCEIFADTGGYSYQSNVNFAFISTCMSAALNYNFSDPQPPVGGGFYPNNGPEVGMPFAWTHRIVVPKSTQGFNTSTYMSKFGYNESDDGNYCYIGFPYGSAALSQSVQSDYPNTIYAYWLDGFFREALLWGLSVHDALHQNSVSTFGMDFSQTDLYSCFNATWPMKRWNDTLNDYEWQNDTGTGSTMAVYGNSNIYLRAPELTVNAFDSDGNPIVANVYIDSQYVGTTGNSFRVALDEYHTVQVATGSYTFRNFTGYSDFENPVTVLVYLDKTVTANYYSNPPPQYTLSVSSGSGGSTSLSSGDHYYTPQKVAVTAYPDNDYVFDYWLLDSVSHSENPIDVPMSGDHTLQANFRSANPHWVTVNAYNQYYYVGSELPVYVDSQYAGETDYYGSFSVLLPEGTHLIAVAEYVDDYYDDTNHFQYPEMTTHTLQYYYFDGDYCYGSDIYVSVTSDETVEAWYYSDG
jgi:hypothetical protein